MPTPIVKSLWQRKNTDIGLLIIRVGIGLSMMLLHGYGKLTAGPQTWERLGGQMARFGLDFFPVFWGFMAMFAEFFCSAAIVLGIAFRPAALLLIGTMGVAAIRHLTLPPDADNAGISGASHALEFMTVFVGLFLAGPGKYTLATLWRRRESSPATLESPS